MKVANSTLILFLTTVTAALADTTSPDNSADAATTALVCSRCTTSHYWDNRCHNCERKYFWDNRCHHCERRYYWNNRCHPCPRRHHWGDRCHSCIRSHFSNNRCHGCRQDSSDMVTEETAEE
ncbi:hypothetical protein H4R33_001853 [Dimargaris cristalligena]|uniref:Uncharacterized protein n=1 Tax=Dimargaris cristalligena TaxID=215637 RepID=A0A4Q0A1J3_9FUNG|nr:hypothetical protein H4R33_001853 [Dimargaris cristalligena]RKP39162.1 hypothetical protein BJ085DRAFT_34007 [Dimargaris cristalligena]|eukprot:RKP39162.1 hypothetical protein BJ085DRAFT_34007 [Dimargaris cristalligena]